MTLVAFALMAGLQTGTAKAQGTEHPGLAKTACLEIALLAQEFSGLTVAQSEGTIHDGKTGSVYPGCRIIGTGDRVAYHDAGWPHDRLRMRMTSDGWREDITRAADGAGSTAFAIHKGAAMCLFSAAWTINDPSEQEPGTQEYKFEVGCFEVDEGG